MKERSPVPASTLRRRLIFFVGVLVAGIAGLLWLLREGGATLAGHTPGPLTDAKAASPATATASPTSADQVADVGRREVVTVDVVPPAADDLVRVRVVRDGDVPAPNATVVTVPPEFEWSQMDADLARRAMRAIDIYDRMEVIGVATTANHEGVVMVRRPTQWTDAIAREPGMFGRVRLEGPEPEGGFVLQLAPDATLTVRVRDANGAPAADLMVGLAATFLAPDAASGDTCAFALATTDAEGHAVVNHVQMLRSNDDGETACEPRIVAFAPGLTDGGVAIDLSSPPPDGIDLELPETGSLRVLVQNGDGSPLRGETICLEDVDRPEARFYAKARDGVAQYPVVGLGRSFHARSHMHAWLLREVGPGPQRPGAKAVLVLRMPTHTAILSGRAIDQNGLALANGRIGIGGDLAAAAGPNDVRTDSEGRFAILFDSGAVGRPLDAVLRWCPPDRRDHGFGGCDARVMGEPLAAGTIQLGDIVFERAPLLASGRLFGIDPLPAVSASAYWQSRTGDWQLALGIAIDVHKDGAFEVRGRIDPGERLRHILQFAGDDCAPVAPVEFVGGERDLQVELRRAASLEARALVDQSVLQHPNVLVFEIRDTTDDDWSAREPEVSGSELRLRIGQLDAGPASLRVRLVSNPEPLATFDDLQLRAGERLREPRLQAIDLRTVRAIRLRLVDERGMTRDIGGEWLPTRLDRVDDYVGFAHGVLWLGCRDAFDVLVFGEGLRPVRAFGPARDTDVRTNPELAVALHLDGLPPPPPRCWFAVGVKPLSRGLAGEYEADTGAGQEREYGCPADGPVPVRVAEPGLVRLRVMLVQDLGATRRTAQVTVRDARFLFDGEHRLAIDSADVARARKELGLPR